MADHVVVNVEEQVAKWFYDKGLHAHARQAIRAADSLPNEFEFSALEMQRIVPMTKEEKAERHAEAGLAELDRVRAERDRLLAASDWTQASDSPLPDDARKAWADYRKKLRDHMNTKNPAKAKWPESPERVE